MIIAATWWTLLGNVAWIRTTFGTWPARLGRIEAFTQSYREKNTTFADDIFKFRTNFYERIFSISNNSSNDRVLLGSDWQQTNIDLDNTRQGISLTNNGLVYCIYVSPGFNEFIVSKWYLPSCRSGSTRTLLMRFSFKILHVVWKWFCCYWAYLMIAWPKRHTEICLHFAGVFWI